MTRKEFQELTGEDPVDLFGEDWENEIENFAEEYENDLNDQGLKKFLHK